jgi:hypothetical protein
MIMIRRKLPQPMAVDKAPSKNLKNCLIDVHIAVTRSVTGCCMVNFNEYTWESYEADKAAVRRRIEVATKAELGDRCLAFNVKYAIKDFEYALETDAQRKERIGKERRSEANRKQYLKNKDKIKENNKGKPKKELSAKQKAMKKVKDSTYYQDNKEKFKQKSKDRYKEKRESILKQQKEYRKENEEKIEERRADKYWDDNVA